MANISLQPRTRKTVGETIALLQTMNPDLPISFAPISDAWMGTFGPMRLYEVMGFTADEATGEEPSVVAYIREEKEPGS